MEVGRWSGGEEAREGVDTEGIQWEEDVLLG